MALRSKKVMVITGGDDNNVDKGIIPAFIGVILKANDLNFTYIKMDPCGDRDAAYLDVQKYGENFCFKDGEIGPISFAFLERISGQYFTKINNITRGKIDDFVKSENEKSQSSGKIRAVNFTVAVVRWIENVFQQPIDKEKKILPDICIIELGRSSEKDAQNNEVSDKTFENALSEFKRKKDFLHIHIAKLFVGRLKDIQKCVQNLRNCGWQPNMIICRTDDPISDVHKRHIAQICGFNDEIEKIINVPKVSHLKQIPIILEEQNLSKLILNVFDLPNGPNFETYLNEWKATVALAESFPTRGKIAIVSCYFKHPANEKEVFIDPCESVVEQLKLAAFQCQSKFEFLFVLPQNLQDDAPIKDHDAAWALVNEADGIVLTSGISGEGFKGKMELCKYCREKKKPCLSICQGFQIAAGEFARNVCGIDAEYNKAFYKVNVKILENGQFRRGARTLTFLRKSKLYELYGKKNFIEERNFNAFEINHALVEAMVSAGFRFVGVGFDENESGEIPEKVQNIMSLARIHDEDDEEGYLKTIQKLCKCSRETGTPVRMQMFELKDHPFYVGILYGAKVGARPSEPSPPFVGLIQAAIQYKELSEASFLDYCSLM